MREEFEKLPEIAQLIEEGKGGNLIFIPETNKYNAEMYITFTPDYVHYLNGAWYTFQEQQKRIDFLNMKLEATKCVSSKRREEVLCRDSKINAAKKEINDFFDNQTMTPSPREYANKLADVLELLK